MGNNKKSNVIGWLIGIIIVVAIVWVAMASYSSSQNSNMADQSGSTAQPGQSTQVTQPTQAAPTAPAKTTPSNSNTTQQIQQPVPSGATAMSPGKNVIQNAMSSSDLTTFVSLVQAAGLTGMLEGPGPFTIFIPSNEAFAKLPAGMLANLMLPQNKQALILFLQYHIVEGTYNAASLFNGEVLGTLAAQNVSVSKSANATIMLNGTSTLLDAGVQSSNGEIFVVDTVLTAPAK